MSSIFHFKPRKVSNSRVTWPCRMAHFLHTALMNSSTKTKQTVDGFTNRMELQLLVPKEHFLTDENSNQDIIDLIADQNAKDYRNKLWQQGKKLIRLQMPKFKIRTVKLKIMLNLFVKNDDSYRIIHTVWVMPVFNGIKSRNRFNFCVARTWYHINFRC